MMAWLKSMHAGQTLYFIQPIIDIQASWPPLASWQPPIYKRVCKKCTLPPNYSLTSPLKMHTKPPTHCKKYVEFGIMTKPNDAGASTSYQEPGTISANDSTLLFAMQWTFWFWRCPVLLNFCPSSNYMLTMQSKNHEKSELRTEPKTHQLRSSFLKSVILYYS